MNREEKRDSHQGSDDRTLGTGAGSGLVLVVLSGRRTHVPHNGGAGYNGGGRLGRGGGDPSGAAVVAAGYASLLG